MKKENLLNYNLQFFGDENSDDASGNKGGTENGDQTPSESGDKTFTQAEVTAMMTKEKKEGKRSILKSLGFETEEDAKKAIEAYNKSLEDKKTDDEKKDEKIKSIGIEKDEALSRAKTAESKLACFEAGVNKDYIDDIMAIASTKVTDDKDLSTVIKEMKDDKKYSNFFGTNDESKGTGGNPGHSNQGGESNESIGESR